MDLPSRLRVPLRIEPAAAILAGASAALGIIWLIAFRPVLYSDYRVYHDLAVGLLDHRQFGVPVPSASRLPGYPMFLAVLMLVSRSVTWLNLWNIVLVAALPLVVFQLTLRLTTGNRRAAAIAAALCAFNPTFVVFSPVVASEHLFVLILFGALALGLGPGPRRRRVVACGVLVGLALLVRGEAAFYAPVLLALIWARSGPASKRRWGAAALFTGCVLATIFPWWVRNTVVVGPGAGLSTVAGVNFYFGHNDRHRYGQDPFMDSDRDLGESELQRHGFQLGWEYLSSSPRHLLHDIGSGTRELLWSPGEFAVHPSRIQKLTVSPDYKGMGRHYPRGSLGIVTWGYRVLLLLATAGLFLPRLIGPQPWGVLYGIVFMNWLCYAVVFFGKPRFRYSVEVVFCVVAAIVAEILWQRMRHTETATFGKAL